MAENQDRPHRRGGDRYRGGRTQGGHSDRGRGGRPSDRRFGRSREDDERIQQIIRNAQKLLAESNQAVCLQDLNAFERKRVHQFFDNKADYETKTYRDGEAYLLWIFPIGKLRQLAEEKAQEALDSGAEIDLPPMSNYERFIIHDALKSWESVETASFGEGAERHIRIIPVRFGRRLKKIVKKIKFF